MIIQKKSGETERTILIAMITEKTVLSKITTKWERDMFSSKWSNLIGKWCVSYYKKYKKAPNKAIKGIFQSWAEDKQKTDKDTVILIEKFLDSLSEEYEDGDGINVDYIVDMSSTYFNKIKLEKLIDTIQGDLDRSELDKATSRVTEFSQVELGIGAGIDLFKDKDAVFEAFDRKVDVLIEYPGSLGVFFGDSLCRDGFIAFQGPEKFGKSFWLLDIAWNALMQGRKVAYFIIGDMSQHQVIKRIGTRAARHPFRMKGGFPATLKYPKSIRRDVDEKVTEIKYGEKEFKAPLSKQKVWRMLKKLGKGKREMFKVSAHPSLSLTVPALEDVIQNWEHNGWGIPDVVVIDYADNLASSDKGIAETRNQINLTWKQMRALSQNLHGLVVTATQSDIASYQVETQSRLNFSEDKRKFAEVTGFLAINRTQEEILKGITRLNWLALRDEEFSESQCVYVAGSAALANPAIVSTF